MKNCVFCDINKIKSDVREVDGCFVFEPLNPIVKGHLLVVNKVHTNDFADNPAIFSLTSMTAAKIASENGGDYNLITSKGKAATQSVFHCHIHLVPRMKGDGLTLPWTNQKK